MKILLLIGLLGCTTGDLNITTGDVASGNVIASKDVVFDYTKIIQESDKARLEWKNYKPTKEDKATQEKGRKEGRQNIEKHFKEKIDKATKFSNMAMAPSVFAGIFQDEELKDFKAFLKREKRMATARPELKIMYYYLNKFVTTSKTGLLIYECHRTIKRQLMLYSKGLSKVKRGKHNTMPSNACDMAPQRKEGRSQRWVAKWHDYRQFHYLVGQAQGIFEFLKMRYGWNLRLRSGTDWDENKYGQQRKEGGFYDAGHLEIKVM